jgi:hypothetical protein
MAGKSLLGENPPSNNSNNNPQRMAAMQSQLGFVYLNRKQGYTVDKFCYPLTKMSKKQ